MSKKTEVRATLTRWFQEGTRSLENESNEREEFVGVLVYAKTTNSRSWKNRVAVAADPHRWKTSPPHLPVTIVPNGWEAEKTFLVGKAATLAEALTMIGLPDPQSSQRRKFTDSFGLGDKVAIIRTEHGWFDGSVSGYIESISDYRCTVLAASEGDYDKHSDGISYEIDHVRDIHLIGKATGGGHLRKKKDKRK